MQSNEWPTSSSAPLQRILVIAKECLPGRVKTRLTPPFDPEQAAALAAASLAQTLDRVRAVDVAERVLLFQGDPAGLDLEGYTVLPQTPGSLDERIAAAFDRVTGPSLLIGMDTPQVATSVLQAVADGGGSDAWFGPAQDGGFWAIGLRAPRGDLVRGVSMSTARTGAQQLRRLRSAGLRPTLLPQLRDVDTVDDALAVAKSVPGTRFAEALDGAFARV